MHPTAQAAHSISGAWRLIVHSAVPRTRLRGPSRRRAFHVGTDTSSMQSPVSAPTTCMPTEQVAAGPVHPVGETRHARARMGVPVHDSKNTPLKKPAQDVLNSQHTNQPICPTRLCPAFCTSCEAEPFSACKLQHGISNDEPMHVSAIDATQKLAPRRRRP